MKKKIWFVICALLLVTVTVLAVTQKKQADETTIPTLPGIREGQGPMVPAPEAGQSDTQRVIPTDTESPEGRNPSETAPSEEGNGMTSPPEEQSFETVPSGMDRDDRSGSETSPAAVDPSEENPPEETESPAETGGYAGFPILPPDIFP